MFVARAVRQVLWNVKQRLKSLYSMMVFLVSNHLSYSNHCIRWWYSSCQTTYHIQITVFADGIPRVKPLIVFKSLYSLMVFLVSNHLSYSNHCIRWWYSSCQTTYHIQITVFADGIPRVKPLIIFKSLYSLMVFLVSNHLSYSNHCIRWWYSSCQTTYHIQITVFADGIPRVKPLIIFKSLYSMMVFFVSNHLSYSNHCIRWWHSSCQTTYHIQITVFADGIPRVKPLIIFKSLYSMMVFLVSNHLSYSNHCIRWWYSSCQTTYHIQITVFDDGILHVKPLIIFKSLYSLMVFLVSNHLYSNHCIRWWYSSCQTTYHIQITVFDDGILHVKPLIIFKSLYSMMVFLVSNHLSYSNHCIRWWYSSCQTTYHIQITVFDDGIPRVKPLIIFKSLYSMMVFLVSNHLSYSNHCIRWWYSSCQTTYHIQITVFDDGIPRVKPLIIFKSLYSMMVFFMSNHLSYSNHCIRWWYSSCQTTYHIQITVFDDGIPRVKPLIIFKSLYSLMVFFVSNHLSYSNHCIRWWYSSCQTTYHIQITVFDDGIPRVKPLIIFKSLYSLMVFFVSNHLSYSNHCIRWWYSSCQTTYHIQITVFDDGIPRVKPLIIFKSLYSLMVFFVSNHLSYSNHCIRWWYSSCQTTYHIQITVFDDGIPRVKPLIIFKSLYSMMVFLVSNHLSYSNHCIRWWYSPCQTTYHIQITVFDDGILRVKPLIIFKGKGLRISAEEKKAWDSRVTVFFQENAWCHEQTMVKWIQSEWNNLFLNPSTPGSDGKILVADIHRAQQTENVKKLLARCKTKLVNAPGGCTFLVQPVDVSFNEPFKGYIRAISERHLNENLEKHTDGKISASERRVLMTKWVGDAWVNTNQDMVCRRLKKCVVSLALDSSENHLLNIEKLPEYTVPEVETGKE